MLGHVFAHQHPAIDYSININLIFGLRKTSSGKKATYGEMASKVAQVAVPKEVIQKTIKDFKIIRTSGKMRSPMDVSLN